MKHLEKIIEFIGEAQYDQYGGGYIWGKNQKGNQMIAQIDEMEEGGAVASIRGWGAIQNMFSDSKESEEFQDELGEFIAQAINEKIKSLKI